MIIHAVLFQPKADISEEQILTVLAHIHSLQEKIHGILSVQSGKNLNTDVIRNKRYTYGFVMQFTDTEALKAYVPHPSHRVVATELESISQSIIDFDIPQNSL